MKVHAAQHPYVSASPSAASRSLQACLSAPIQKVADHALAAPLAKAGGRAAWYCDLAVVLQACGLTTWQDLRVFDLGCGDAEFLSVVGDQGADCVGIEKATAPITDFEQDLTIHRGTLANLDTDTPADVFVSRNTLKRGFVRPIDGTAARFTLGSTVHAALAAIAEKTRVGGLFCIYNVSPTDPALAHEAHTDGHCPFSRQELEAAGFEVMLHDADATALTAAVAQQLANPALASGICSLLTLCVRKPTGPFVST